MKSILRQIRSGLASAAARGLAASPRLERMVIGACRTRAARWRLSAGLYAALQTALLGRLAARGTPLRLLAVGPTELLLDIRDDTGRLQYFFGEPYEPDVVRLLATHLREGDVFLDVGANLGFFTLLAARLVGQSGRVEAFEPHPDAQAALTHLAERNGVSGRITLHRAAVGETAASRVPLYLTDASVLSALSPQHAPGRPSEEFRSAIDVPMTTLDEWARASPSLVPRVRLAKIDVEGSEHGVIRGALGLLAQCRHVIIVCETKADSPADTLLRELGFQAATMDHVNRSYVRG